VRPPLGDEILQDHASEPATAFTASFQRSRRSAPPFDLARTSGATRPPRSSDDLHASSLDLDLLSAILAR
jgi:hypothetical protein